VWSLFTVTSPENNTQAAALRELQSAKTIVAEVLASLEAQKAILKQRGMSLPPMVTSTLGDIQRDLTNLENHLVEEQAELGQLRALADMSARITTTLDVNTVLEEAMDIVIALTRAERGYIILVNSETGQLDYRVAREDSLSPMSRYGGDSPAGKPQISNTILRHVLDAREALLADNAFQDERLQGNVSIANFALRSVLCVPLSYRDNVIGVVYVDNRLQAGIFTEREKNTLTAFANTAAVAIANALLYTEIQQTLNEITQVKVLMDNVFASIGSGVIATDAEDTIETFNRAAEQILGRAADTAVRKPLALILPKISADLGEYLDNVRLSGEPQIIDGEFLVQDRRIAVSMKLTPLKDMQDNTTRGVAVVLDDMTSQVENTQQLRVIKNYLPPELVDSIHTISRLALGGERREVSCMFVEVRPIKSLEDLPPTEVMEMLNQFLSVATRCIYDTRGVIDKYMGNEVMALYNTQLNPQENHSWQCVESALRMRDGFVDLYKQLGIDPQPHYYRIGLHTGICTLGNVGSLTRRDFTAIGDSINLSKRLEENAAYAQIIVSENTIEHLKACAPQGAPLPYRFESRGSLKVKGKTIETPIYEVFRA
jgi:adenylate cyclase